MQSGVLRFIAIGLFLFCENFFLGGSASVIVLGYLVEVLRSSGLS